MRAYFNRVIRAGDVRPDVADSLRGLVRRFSIAARMARTAAERSFYLRGAAGALTWLDELEPRQIPIPLRADSRRTA